MLCKRCGLYSGDYSHAGLQECLLEVRRLIAAARQLHTQLAATGDVKSDVTALMGRMEAVEREVRERQAAQEAERLKMITEANRLADSAIRTA